VAYLDLTGSGAETIARLRQNGRIVLMFMALEGRPDIVRLHGKGEVVLPGDPRFDEKFSRFSQHPGVRSIIVVAVHRVADTCGLAVPKLAARSPGSADDRPGCAVRVTSAAASALPRTRRKLALDGSSVSPLDRETSLTIYPLTRRVPEGDRP